MEREGRSPAGLPAGGNGAQGSAAPRAHEPMSWPMRLVLAFVAANAPALQARTGEQRDKQAIGRDGRKNARKVHP